MDPHIKLVEELFSAAKTEFKHHNCLYEGVWTNNKPFGPDYKCIFVGDASMSPYEVAYPGGANEHWNAEAGVVWLKRARDQWPSNLWINPLDERYWRHTQSTQMIQSIFGADRMVPMTLNGIDRGMRLLSR